MDTETHPNGTEQRVIPVPTHPIAFGKRPTQVLTVEQATAFLTLFADRQPAQFGGYLAEIMTGTAPKAARG